MKLSISELWVVTCHMGSHTRLREQIPL